LQTSEQKGEKSTAQRMAWMGNTMLEFLVGHYWTGIVKIKGLTDRSQRLIAES
jgi:hypothetical protein